MGDDELVSEDVENVENGTVTKGTSTSLQPHFFRTHPTESVPARDKCRAFLSPHAHAAHRIIAHRRIPTSLRLLQQPHQRHPSLFGFPQLPLRRQRRRKIHARTRPPRTHVFGSVRIRILTRACLLLLLLWRWCCCSSFVPQGWSENPGGAAAADSGESEAFFERASPPLGSVDDVHLVR